jgi:acyl carrier protein
MTTIDQGELLAHYENVLARFDNVLAEHFFDYKEYKKAGFALTFQTTIKQLSDVLMFDELDVVELIEVLENDFDINIPDGVFESWNIALDLARYIGDATFEGEPELLDTVDATDDGIDPDTILGNLLLPSVEEHGRFIEIAGVTVTEARELVNDFADKVASRRKTKLYKGLTDADSMDFFYNFIDASKTNADFDHKLTVELFALSESHVPTYRGLRAFYINPKVIGVGTTVIFNKNWATLNFSENGIGERLAELQAEYENA